MTVSTPAPVRTRKRPLPPPRLAERALDAANGNRSEALLAAVFVYRRILDEWQREQG